MKKLSMYLFVFIISFMSLRAVPACAFMDEIPEGLEVQSQLVIDNGTLIGVVELHIAKDYYAYASGNAQSVGLPTQLIVTNSTGKIFPSYLPAGVERQDYYEKDKRILAYNDKIFLFADLGLLNENTKNETSFTAKLSMLLCSKQHCLPVRVPLTFQIPTTPLPSLQTQPFATLFHATKALGNANAALMQAEVAQPQQQASSSTSLSKLQGKLDTFDTRSHSPSDVATQNSTEQGPKDGNQPTTWNFSPQPFTEGLEVSSLGKALLFGLLAGLILNLMPCVLPVLTLKMHSLLRSEDGEERKQAFKIHNLYFAAGIMCQFFLLAIILGSAKLMWGELFQNVYFVSFMLVIIFALALSLMGLFTLPIIDLKASASLSPRRQAFVTGMVATLLATPCSGPLLGGVLSWTLLQPLYLIIIIITTVGIGMSLPYLLFAVQPHYVRFLPKPGNWMHALERFVAFFLLATAVYIFSVLPSYAHITMLATLLLVAFCGWLWGHFGGLSAPKWRRRILAGVFLLSMTSAVVYGVKAPQASEFQWENFMEQSFVANLGKKAMVVEFTADWCPN